jgi:hypothetical protein
MSGQKIVDGKEPTKTAICLYHFLANCLPEAVKHARIFTDGCTSQKNYILMLFFQFLCRMHNIEITHTYPVPGYSYLPLDRCLG